MRKIVGIVLFVLPILLTGWTLNNYMSSGEKVLLLNLDTSSGALDPFELDPAMSPVRAFLKVKYEIHVQDMTSEAYRYDVDVKGPAGRILLSDGNTHSVKKDDQGAIYERSTMNHLIGTFDVVEEGAFFVEWSVAAKKAKIKEMSLELRRNVAELNVANLVLAAVCFFLGWFVVFTGRRKTVNSD